MYTYKDMKQNYEIIKEFCHFYREELTVYAGVLAEQWGGTTYSEYVNFTNELSEEEFLGNYLCGLLTDEPKNEFKKILDGEQTFVEYIGKVTNDDVVKDYCEKFYNHYESIGWVNGTGREIKNWKLVFNNWLKKDNKQNDRREINQECNLQ